MQSEFSVAGFWDGGFDESALQQWAGQLRGRLHAPAVTLGILFVTPAFVEHASGLLELLRVHARIPLLVGCSTQGLVVGDREIEEQSGLVLGLYHLPGANLKALHFTQSDVENAAAGSGWVSGTGVAPEDNRGWLVFIDPYHLDSESWLMSWNKTYAPGAIVGGLACGPSGDPLSQVFLNGEVFEEGGVAVSFGGGVSLVGVVSQGCTPIGETWTITKADRNYIREIGNRKAYQVLVDTYNGLAPEDQEKTRGNLLVGLVIDEYREAFQRGDFLIRNLLGADTATGSLAIGAWPRMGQTMQFQRRDAAAATEDMEAVLSRARTQLEPATVYGGCLCLCNGRGKRMFGEGSHDARLVQQHLGPLGLTGLFCNGEIGPVGGRSYIHGFTSALALFVKA
jgi:small ligand-binding sensory domain FIST